MPPAAADSAAATRAARWLGLAFVAAPFAQTLEWDFDRAAPLALLPLPLWAGRATLARALGRFCRQAPRAIRTAALIAALSALLATAFSPQPAAALVTLASWTLLGLGAFLAGGLVTENPRHSRSLLGAIAVSAALGTACHWVRWKTGLSPEAAFYPHHRLMGLHLLSGAVAATMLLFGAAGRGRLLWLAVGGIAWGGLLWTGGRAPLAGALGGLALVAVCSRTNRVRLAGALCAHLGLGLALAAALDAHKPHLGWSRLWQRTAEASSAQEFTSNRSDFWHAAWSRALEAPWLGRGPDAYRFLEPKLEGSQPHNALLQWALDLGFPGALALAALVGCALGRSAVVVRTSTGENELAVAPWLAIAGASFFAGQLDGFFYHQVALFPAAIALGLCALAGTDGGLRPSSPAWAILAGGAASAILLLHAWLFHRVALAAPPAPGDRVVRLWRAFPSATLGLERWIDAWRDTAPEAALALSRHAQAHSSQGDFFRVQTAGVLLRRGERAAALRELDAALAIAPWQMRPVIERLRGQLAAADAAPRD